MQLFTFFILYICSTVTNANNAVVYQVQGKPFSLSLPASWKNVSTTSVNFIAQGPEYDGTHSALFVSHTGLDRITFNAPRMEHDLPEYYAGRKEYIESKGGKLLKKILYEHSQIKGQEIFYVGVDYRLGDEVYYERSQYISCRGSIFQVKSLDFETLGKPGSALQVGRTFACKN